MSPDLRIRDVLATDPITARIPNQGVANVNQDETIQDELRNFVCEGQYAKGLDRILDSYLSSLNSDEQPAVWVSGFYGSGKSHFVKMLTYLWTDRTFDDGASARGLVQIPDEITHHFRELSTRGKQAGGLTAAAGILDKNLSVELGLLSILFQAAGFSSQYHIARLQMWLRDQGVLAAVAKRVTDAGKDFGRELRNMHVSPVLADAILQEVPGLAADEKGVRDALLKEYAKTDKVTLDEMLDAIRDLLVVDDRIPCTLVVLDELQQYIGDSSDRSLQVQMVTEACCKRFGGRLLFIGTGQSALSETPNLQKLMGRFTVPVELSDADVETVIRRLLLAKKPDRLPAVKSFLQTHSGEIDRHLCGTLIAPRPEDSNNLATDYPILPVRQRFWERILRAIDKPGTAAQLRTQLRMVHEALRTVAESPLGAVVSADFIFDQQYQQMKQSGTLLRDIDDTIQKHRDGTPDGQLKSRLCALAFLIGLLPRDMGADIGLRARSDMIADLMVNDLADGGTELRKRIPELLEELAASGDLMKIGDEYRIQTRESAAWESEFRGLYAKKVNDPSFIASERNQLLHGRVGEIIAKLQPKHGKAKVPRKLAASYGSTTPVQDGESVPIWVRDGWEGSLNSVREDARQGGAQDPTVYVFLPHQDSDQLKESIAAWRAAEEVLAIRGMPTTDEGREAHSAMKSRMERHESEASRYADRVVGHATVLQGGGGEVAANDLQSAILDAAKNALVRLFPQFELADADSIAWGKVVERARKGDGDCLRVVGHSGNVPEHPVCKAIMGYLSTSRTGNEIRKQFEQSPYGWPKDAVTGAILALVNDGAVAATFNGSPTDSKSLDANSIGKASFRSVSVVPTMDQKIAVRKLVLEAGVSCTSGEEVAKIPVFLDGLVELAGSAGGEPPLPEKPGTVHIADLRAMSGNELLVAVADAQDQLRRQFNDWRDIADRIAKRLPAWERLESLLPHAVELPVFPGLKPQIDAVSAQRALLNEPDPVAPLLQQLADALRNALQEQVAAYYETHAQQQRELEAADAWQRITEQQRNAIASECHLAPLAKPSVGTDGDLAAALNHMSLSAWADATAALPTRFGNARLAAEKLLAPELVHVKLKSESIASPSDLQAYIDDLKQRVETALNAGKNVLLGP